MEQVSVYNSLNFAISASDSEDGTVQATGRSTQINSFLCPSSGLPSAAAVTSTGVGGYDWGPGSSNGGTYGADLTWVNNRYTGNNYFASVGPCTIPWSLGNSSGVSPFPPPVLPRDQGSETPGWDQQYHRLRRMADGRLGSQCPVDPGCRAWDRLVAGFDAYSNDTAASTMPAAGMTNFQTLLSTLPESLPPNWCLENQ